MSREVNEILHYRGFWGLLTLLAGGLAVGTVSCAAAAGVLAGVAYLIYTVWTYFAGAQTPRFSTIFMGVFFVIVVTLYGTGIIVLMGWKKRK